MSLERQQNIEIRNEEYVRAIEELQRNNIDFIDIILGRTRIKDLAGICSAETIRFLETDYIFNNYIQSRSTISNISNISNLSVKKYPSFQVRPRRC